MHICHLTSAHSRYDSRIFQKQCRSIAKSGSVVTLILADGKGNEVIDGVTIVDVGVFPGRINRMFRTTKLIYEAALKTKADIYQFHDPELLYVGLKLKKKKKRVVFDSHEDAVGSLLVKPYLKPPFHYIISMFYGFFEKFVCKRLDGIIGATPVIVNIFSKISNNIIEINNYPIIAETEPNLSWDSKKREVCYVGSISTNRGGKKIVEAMDYVTSYARLNLVGQFAYPAIEEEIRKLPSFDKINEYGYVNRGKVQDVYACSIAGIITSLPIPTYIESLPIKMFEYMAANIPFIASDFPNWRELMEGYDCCIFVDPLNPKEIAAAIDFFVMNQSVAKKMGERGRELVCKKYDWKYEAEKLLNFYHSILNK
jgi:glycosyltransferase involved in cell wall biosynthesis